MSAYAAAGALACSAALGAWLPALLLPAALWLLAWRSRGLGHAFLVLAAPLALAAATPLPTVLTWRLAPAGVVVALAVVPLMRALGPGRPPARVGAVVAGALIVPVAFLLTPPGSVLAASDLAHGSAVGAAAAGLLVASALARRS